MADLPVPSLHNQTPLQHANTPAMDAVAASGITGLMDPVEPGVSPGTDTAHLSIFGYDPRRNYRGRGAFETIGAGLSMLPGDIAFKSNFATIDDSGVVVRRRVDREFTREGPILSDSLDGIEIPGFPQHSVAVRYATEHRCAVRIRGPHLTDAITSTDPLKDGLLLLTAQPLNHEHSANTAKIVNAVSDAIRVKLSKHPVNEERASLGKPIANVVLLRGCGAILDVEPFSTKYLIERPIAIAPTCIVAGLVTCLGFTVLSVKGATGDYHTDMHAKAVAFVDAMRNGKAGFGFLHLKAVDDAGHDGDALLKVQLLEKADAMLKEVIAGLAADSTRSYTVVLTADHTTPVQLGDHSCEPVPIAIAHVKDVAEGRKHPADDVVMFDEASALKGSMKRFLGEEFMRRCIQFDSTI